MHDRKALVALLALAALAATCSCQAGVVLRYRMAPGEVQTYDVKSIGTGTLNAMGRTDPVETDVRFVYVSHCESVDAAGRMTVRHAVKDLEVQAVCGAQAIPVQLQIPTVVTVITPTGEVVSSRVETAAPAGAGGLGLGPALGALTGDTPFDAGQLFGELRGPGFPDKAVEAGNRWQQSLLLRTRSGQPLQVSYTTTCLDFAVLEGRPCARLQTDYELPLDLSLTAGALLQLQGKQKGTQIVYFDHEAGRVARFDGTSDSALTMGAPALFGGAAQQDLVALTLRTTITGVLRPPPVL